MHPTGNGYITTAVLRDILAALDDKLTDEDLDGMIDEIDEDGSGTVDFEGFKFKHIIFFKLIYSIFIENFTEFMEMMVTVLIKLKLNHLNHLIISILQTG